MTEDAPAAVVDPAAPRGADVPGSGILRDRVEAEAYVASVCFKHGPPRMLGAEIEWLLQDSADPHAPIDPAKLAAALGEHAPATLDPDSPARPLPAGCTITLEPGGQVELASPPLPGFGPLVQALESDADRLHGALAAAGLRVQPRAADPLRPPVRLLDAPRYRAMEQVFARFGPYGRSAMNSTAAVQVCLDPGEDAELIRRWRAAHAFGPVLLAAFANSPRLHGRRTGWKSSRWACWMRAEPARTDPPPLADVITTVPAEAWARRVLDSPVLCVRRGANWLAPGPTSFARWIEDGHPEPPTLADLDYHVSTLFPPVRPRGYLEVRYIDGQQGRRWALPAAVLTALLADPTTADVALEACEPAQGRWGSAARHGLVDRVLARAAGTLFGLACARLPDLDAPDWVGEELIAMTERQVLRGRCPADDPEETG